MQNLCLFLFSLLRCIFYHYSKQQNFLKDEIQCRIIYYFKYSMYTKLCVYIYVYTKTYIHIHTHICTYFTYTYTHMYVFQSHKYAHNRRWIMNYFIDIYLEWLCLSIYIYIKKRHRRKLPHKFGLFYKKNIYTYRHTDIYWLLFLFLY